MCVPLKPFRTVVAFIKSWNSTGKIGRIGRHLADKPDVEVTMCLGPMPPSASDFPGGIPAFSQGSVDIGARCLYEGGCVILW